MRGNYQIAHIISNYNFWFIIFDLGADFEKSRKRIQIRTKIQLEFDKLAHFSCRISEKS